MGTISAKPGSVGADSDDGVSTFLAYKCHNSRGLPLQDEDWEDEDDVNPLNKDEIVFLTGKD